jgi:uncharacterized RDD family membrane protein YckC
MSGAAQRIDGTAALEFESVDEALPGLPATDSGLKQAVAERLAAHREKRAAVRQQLADLTAQKMRESSGGRGSSKVREAVAARYQQSQSYREFLAAEAERALQQAQAEAEVAARNARAVADAKLQLFEEMEQWDRFGAPGPEKMELRGELAHALADIAMGAEEFIREARFEAGEFEAVSFETPRIESVGLSVQLYEDLEMAAPTLVRRSVPFEPGQAEELAALEEEIDFRRAPVLGEFVVEAQAIPANIIEFPRQLIAPKKARPRLAEGPLRDEAPQLRIFEVDAEQISAEPVAQSSAAPDWQSMKLEATAAAVTSAPQYAQTHFTLQPQTASIARRVMAAAVDAICVGAGWLAFVAVAAEVMGRQVQMLPKPLLGVAAGAVLFVLYVAYELLFFSLSGDTPGMRYARIGLCTFGDRNPSRKAMRRRIFATLLAVFPVGLGLLWACLDDERLGWHDRMSRMYQRAY